MLKNQTLMKVGLEIDVPKLGQRIREIRHQTGRTITQLAADADLSVANWYAIEQERVKVLPIATLKRIERVLGVDFEVEKS
ncbi:MAG: helix-turn-helix domain-containing protein [Xenococcaceae cyanobacterium]